MANTYVPDASWKLLSLRACALLHEKAFVIGHAAAVSVESVGGPNRQKVRLGSQRWSWGEESVCLHCMLPSRSPCSNLFTSMATMVQCSAQQLGQFCATVRFVAFFVPQHSKHLWSQPTTLGWMDQGRVLLKWMHNGKRTLINSVGSCTTVTEKEFGSGGVIVDVVWIQNNQTPSPSVIFVSHLLWSLTFWKVAWKHSVEKQGHFVATNAISELHTTYYFWLVWSENQVLCFVMLQLCRFRWKEHFDLLKAIGCLLYLQFSGCWVASRLFNLGISGALMHLASWSLCQTIFAVCDSTCAAHIVCRWANDYLV